MGLTCAVDEGEENNEDGAEWVDAGGTHGAASGAL